MTPKEKALIIFHSFEEYVESKDTTDNVTITDFKLKKENQKQCALICVDEILKTKPTSLNDKINPTVYFFGNNQTEKYWQSVKSEITNL